MPREPVRLIANRFELLPMLRVGESKETAGPVASHEIGEFFQFPPMCCEDGIRIGITWLPEDVDQRDRPSLISKCKT